MTDNRINALQIKVNRNEITEIEIEGRFYEVTLRKRFEGDNTRKAIVWVRRFNGPFWFEISVVESKRNGTVRIVNDNDFSYFNVVVDVDFDDDHAVMNAVVNAFHNN